MNIISKLKNSSANTKINNDGVEVKPYSIKFKLLKKKKVFLIISIVLILAVVLFSAFGKKDKSNIEESYTEMQVARGNIIDTIEQSGVVEPFERYEITSLVKGEIISSPFEEGDTVEEGDTLYQIDDEDAQLNIEKAQNNLEKTQISLNETYENIANLNIYAPSSGKLTEFSLKVGDNVNSGVIGKINNSEKISVNVPFSTTDYAKISVGDNVTVTSSLYMTSLKGVVSYKYSANADLGQSGSVMKNIEVSIENPGALAEGTTLAATVHTSSGDVYSTGSGTIENGTSANVKAKTSGEVKNVLVKEGDYVKKGQLLAVLENDSLTNSVKSGELGLKDSKLSLKSTENTLENYNITAPISGTIITKNSKAGDKIDNSNSQTVMMVIADISKMKFTITVDELDIADISLGQKAVVDADAIPDKTFEAEVTSIASEGVSSGDGVTTFTVELTINEPGDLKSGMNVNANIVINQVNDVLTIPEDALMSVKGSSAQVLAKVGDNNKDSKELKDVPENKSNSGKPEAGGMNFESGKPEAGSMNFESGASGIPEGYELRNVEIGVSDGTNIEIISGLAEGEVIAYIPSASGSGQTGLLGMMGAMHSGMMGGGMPNGGMPSGNRGNGGNNKQPKK